MSKINPLRAYYRFFAVLGAICAVAILVNLLVRRAPVHDANAVSDMQAISAAVDNFYSVRGTLPSDLADLTEIAPAVKQRFGNYQYVPMAAQSYQLCTTFQSDTMQSNKNYYVPAYGHPDPSRHARGRQCFSYTVGPYGGPVPLMK